MKQKINNTTKPQHGAKLPVSGSADRYTKKLDKDWDDDIYTIEEWDKAVDDGWITSDDGSGYWVKDGLKSRDEVFSTPQLDATHVVWYNK